MAEKGHPLQFTPYEIRKSAMEAHCNGSVQWQCELGFRVDLPDSAEFVVAYGGDTVSHMNREYLAVSRPSLLSLAIMSFDFTREGRYVIVC